MAKRVLVVKTSLRNNSNSDALAEEFARGAREAGNEVEVVSLKKKEIHFCNGCLACFKKGRCVIPDDAPDLVEKMHDAEVIAFATPIYYYEMSGQMKTLLDRANPLFGGDYRFQDIYLLMTAADAEKETVDGAVKGLEGWIACFDRARLAGTVFGGGADGAGEIAGHPAMKEAYEMGRTIQ